MLKTPEEIARELVGGVDNATGHYIPTTTREWLEDTIANAIREARAEAISAAADVVRDTWTENLSSIEENIRKLADEALK